MVTLDNRRNVALWGITMKCPDCGIDENTPVMNCTRRHGPLIPYPITRIFREFADIKPNIVYPRTKIIYYGNIGYLIAGVVIGAIAGSLVVSILW
jgi:hypothetical protein